MSLEKNKAIVRKVIEEVNKKNLAVLDEFMALDFVFLLKIFNRFLNFS